MRSARLVPVIALGAGLAVLIAPASAAPKPITKSFSVNIPVPDATPSQTCIGAVNVPGNRHIEKFKAPAKGVLKLEISGFYGDWDLAILDAKGKHLSAGDNAAATGGNPNTGNIVEKATFKVKKAGALQLVVCNFAGGPTGKGKYTFTYA